MAQPAASQAVSISDDSGDAYWHLNGKPVPAYLDIVAAEISLEDGVFKMTMVMAGEIPEKPALMKGVHVYWWEWAIDSDEGQYPIWPGRDTVEECTVIVAWDGEEWTAMLYDYTTVVDNWRDGYLIRDLDHEPIGGSPELVVYVPEEWIYSSEDFDWAGAILGWLTPMSQLTELGDKAGDNSWAWWGIDEIGIDRSTWTYLGHWP